MGEDKPVIEQSQNSHEIELEHVSTEEELVEVQASFELNERADEREVIIRAPI